MEFSQLIRIAPMVLRKLSLRNPPFLTASDDIPPSRQALRNTVLMLTGPANRQSEELGGGLPARIPRSTSYSLMLSEVSHQLF